MGAGGLRFGAVWVAAMLAALASAQESKSVPPRKSDASHRSRGSLVPGSVLLTPVQGTASLRARDGARVAAAVRRGLEAHGYHASLSQELLGRALVVCQAPECIEQALDAAGAEFGIVPAIWLRESGGEEVTLTLVQRSGRSLNATGVVGDDLAAVTVGLVEGLLARRAVASAAAAGSATATGSASVIGTGTGGELGRPHAWKAGPIILIAAGAAAVVAIGVGAGVKGDDQQLNTSAVAAGAALGAAAIGGGVAWWLVGEKRRRKNGGFRGPLAAELALHPTKIDLTLRF